MDTKSKNIIGEESYMGAPYAFNDISINYQKNNRRRKFSSLLVLWKRP
jgi:hypothetical protein